MARTKVPLAERWKLIHEQDAARKFKAKRRYKTAWENAKNHRIWRAEEAANAADYRAVVDAAIKARRDFERKYANSGLVKHVSPAKIKKQLPQLKKPRKLTAVAKFTINAKRRADYAAKKAAMKEKEESTT